MYLLIDFPFFNRSEDESVSRAMLTKQQRDLQSQIQELSEDLDSEKQSRMKAEKQKRDLNEVILFFSAYIIS